MSLLGGLTPQKFLQRHWQKRPLLIRNALPAFCDLLGREQLFDLACRDDVQSRLVVQGRRMWNVVNGPFRSRYLRKLGHGKWSLLVQDVNQVLPDAQRLLMQFDFIPYARMDDVMISCAPPGGGVGPHFDSYDVFLLQGSGQRLWQISMQKDLRLMERVPLKILKNFKPEREWVLGPGDMLYLPPRCAHNGVALNECITYSIGFRAPSAQELATHFLAFLEDHLRLKTMYRDPWLTPQQHPAQISDAMLGQAIQMLERVHWGKRDIELFLGKFLSDPKPLVIFRPPSRPLSQERFSRKCKSQGIHLDLKSQMLFRRSVMFINGEAHHPGPRAFDSLSRLADSRELKPGTTLDRKSRHLLYQWYRAGYIKLGRMPQAIASSHGKKH
ncbi:MAG TPA: cupin domain-containing protein [Burkholderiales bacterium]|nr:cupin domain-containing protein [Burkholderiales bacterium]